VEEIFLSLLTETGFRKVDALFIIIIYYIRRHDMKVVIALRDKYNLLNTLIANIGWIIRLTQGITAIKHHRSGDIEIVTAIDGIDVPKVYKEK